MTATYRQSPDLRSRQRHLRHNSRATLLLLSTAMVVVTGLSNPARAGDMSATRDVLPESFFMHLAIKSPNQLIDQVEKFARSSTNGTALMFTTSQPGFLRAMLQQQIPFPLEQLNTDAPVNFFFRIGAIGEPDGDIPQMAVLLPLSIEELQKIMANMGMNAAIQNQRLPLVQNGVAQVFSANEVLISSEEYLERFSRTLAAQRPDDDLGDATFMLTYDHAQIIRHFRNDLDQELGNIAQGMQQTTEQALDELPNKLPGEFTTVAKNLIAKWIPRVADFLESLQSIRIYGYVEANQLRVNTYVTPMRRTVLRELAEEYEKSSPLVLSELNNMPKNAVMAISSNVFNFKDFHATDAVIGEFTADFNNLLAASKILTPEQFDAAQKLAAETRDFARPVYASILPYDGKTYPSVQIYTFPDEEEAAKYLENFNNLIREGAPIGSELVNKLLSLITAQLIDDADLTVPTFTYEFVEEAGEVAGVSVYRLRLDTTDIDLNVNKRKNNIEAEVWAKTWKNASQESLFGVCDKTFIMINTSKDGANEAIFASVVESLRTNNMPLGKRKGFDTAIKIDEPAQIAAFVAFPIDALKSLAINLIDTQLIALRHIVQPELIQMIEKLQRDISGLPSNTAAITKVIGVDRGSYKISAVIPAKAVSESINAGLAAYLAAKPIIDSWDKFGQTRDDDDDDDPLSLFEIPEYDETFMTEKRDLVTRSSKDNIVAPFFDDELQQECWEAYICRNKECPKYDANGDTEAEQHYIFPKVIPALIEMRDAKRGPWGKNFDPDQQERETVEYMNIDNQQVNCPICKSVLVERYLSESGRAAMDKLMEDFADDDDDDDDVINIDGVKDDEVVDIELDAGDDEE